MHTRRRSIAFKFETTGTNSVRVQRRRGAYVWVQRAACWANHAKSPTAAVKQIRTSIGLLAQPKPMRSIIDATRREQRHGSA